MKITKYICANFLSLLGNLGLLLILSYIYLVVLVYPDYLIDGLVFSLLNIYKDLFIYVSYSYCFITNRRYIST